MVITLTGENEFGVAAAERALIFDFLAKFGAHGIERVDGEGYDPAGLPQLLQGASLFATERLVVLKDAGKNKPLWEALADWADKVPSETTLVIVEPLPDKRTRTYKTLKIKGDLKELHQLSDGELAAWAQAKAKELGGTLSRADAQYLVERTGRDQWRLNHEIEKLANYQNVITRDVVAELVEPNPEGNAFELLDAALGGDSAQLAARLHSLKTQEDPYKLFGLLASQVHTLAVVSAAGTRSADQVAKEAGLHPFVVRKTQGVARRLGPSAVRRVVDDVALCDFQLKSTGADPWQLIGNCLHKIAVLG